MCISQKKYDCIIERLQELERAVDVPCSTTEVGMTVALLLRHLGLRHERTRPTTTLVKVGGPERGE